MPQLVDFFGKVVVTARRSRNTPTVEPNLRRSRFKNPSGGGEPCLAESRQGSGDLVDQLLSLTTNLCFTDWKKEREFTMRRLDRITVKGVLEILPGFLLKKPNYHPVQAIDYLEDMERSRP